MGRNSKKNKGRKPATEQGLKGAASLASSSANVANAPARPARTPKHKVRKFPPQPTTAPTQANDSQSARGLKDIQPLPAPSNTVKHEPLLSGSSPTSTSETPRTYEAIITESPATVSSSNEKEITFDQPNLSDSYDSSSASSSETEICMKENVPQISNTDNVPETQKIEPIETTPQTQNVSVLQQSDKKPKGLVEEEYSSTSLVDTVTKEVPQRADRIEHTSGLLAVLSVEEPFTSSSPSLHSKLEAKVSELYIQNVSRTQAAEEIISFREGAKQKDDSPLQASQPDKDDRIHEVLSSHLETEGTKQAAGDDRSSGPAIMEGKEDSNQVNAASGVSEQSSSESQISLINALGTSSLSPDNLQQKFEELQELEIVLESFDKGLDKDKKNDTENCIEEMGSTRHFTVHQLLLSAAAHNVVQEPLEKNDLTEEKNEESRQVNRGCINEIPLCSIESPRGELEVSKVTMVEEEKELDKKPSHLADMTRNSPEVEVLKLESATLEECQKGMPDHVDSGYVCKQETNLVENQQKKELEIYNAAVNEEESPEEKPDRLNRGEGHVTNSVDSEKDKLQVGEPEVKDTTLNKDDCLQVKPDHIHGGSVDSEKDKLQVGDPEVEDISLDKEDYLQEKPAHIPGTSVDGETDKLQVGEPEVKDISLNKENYLQEKPDHIHEASVDSEKDKLQVGEPEVKDINLSLNKEDFLQEKPDHIHGTSVCHPDFQEQKIQTPENGTQKLDEGEPLEGGVAVDEGQKCKEDEPNQQLDGAIEGSIKSIEREMEEFEVGQPRVKTQPLDKDECLQGKTDRAYSSPVSQEDGTTEALKNMTNKLDVEEALNSQEEKSDQQLHGGTRCEAHATNSNESAIEEESEADLLTFNKDDCQEEKTDQAKSGSFCKEHETEDNLENLEKVDSQEEDVTLNQACQEDKPDHVDSDTVCQEHNRSSENETKKLEVEGLGIATVIEEEKECQERHTPSGDKKMDWSLHEVESDTLEEKKDGKEETPRQVVSSFVDEEQNALSAENQVEKPGIGGLDSEDIALNKETESLEDQNEKGIASEDNAEPFNNIKMGEVEIEMPEVKVDKEECQEEKHHEAEEQKTQFLEDAPEKPYLEERVMLDINQEMGDTSAQVERDSVCQEHPTSSMENKKEILEMGELEKAIMTEDGKKSEEEHDTTILLEKEMEQPKPVEGIVTLEEDTHGPEKVPYQTDSGHVFKDQEMHSVENDVDKPEVAEKEIEGIELQKEKEIKQDLDQLTYEAKPCVDRDKEKHEGGMPEVALNKDECKQEKHYQDTEIFLCEEHQQSDLEHAKEKPVMVEPQVEGVKLDKDLKSQEDKPNQASSDSGSQEHPTSYSKENQNENAVRELEKAIALEDEKQLHGEHTIRTVENDTEQPKPQMESVTPDEKKESPSEMQDHIESGHVGEEHKHSVEEELEKPEVGEADEIMGLYKKKDSKEDKPGQLEGGTSWKEDADDSSETETGTLAVGKPDEEELEEGKHQQDQEKAFITSNQEETQAGALDKQESEEERYHQDDNGYVYEEKGERDFSENAMETSNLEEPQVKDLILDKEENDCQESDTTKSVDHEMEEPQPEAEIALEEKKESKPNQIDCGSAYEEYKLLLLGTKLQEIETGEPEAESNAVSGREECQEQEFEQLEKRPGCEEDAKNSFESETDTLEARKPEVKSTAMQEDCKDPKDDQADDACVCEEHQVADLLEYAMEKSELGEPKVEGGMLGENQEPPEEESDQVDRGTVCQEHPSNSVVENLDVGEPQIANAGKEEEHTKSFMDTGMQQPNPEIGHTPIEESPDHMPDQIEGSNMDEDHKMLLAENELQNFEMESHVERDAFQQKQESQVDQLEQLDRGPMCEAHTKNSVEIEVGKPEMCNTTIDNKESKEGKNDQADSGFACEKHQTTQFLEDAVENIDVEQAQRGEGAALDNEQEMPEKNLDQTDNDSACKDDTERAFENKIEKIEIEEPEAAIALHKERGYQEEPCQIDVCNRHSMSADENIKAKEPEIAQVEKTQESQEEMNEGASVCNKHDTISVDISGMEEPELEDLVVCQRNEKGKAYEVSSSFPNEELITESVQKDLERLEVDAGHASLALKEKEDCLPNQVDHTSSVCDEQVPESVVRKLELNELEEPEQGVPVSDKREFQDVTLNEKNKIKESEADKVSDSSPIEQLITDSEKKDMEKLEMDEGQIGLAFEKTEKCAQKSVVGAEAMKYQEEEPTQIHSSSKYEEQTTLTKNESEKTQMEEPKVDHVKLDKNKLSQEEKLESCCQNTTSPFKGETDKFVLEEPEKLAAALETMDCNNESYQLDIEPVSKENNPNSPTNEAETLEIRDPEGIVKLDVERECQEEKPADTIKIPQGQEQTTSSLNIKLERLEVEDPEVTFEEDKEPQDDKPSQQFTSAFQQQGMGEKIDPTDQLEREPEGLLAEIQGCHEDKSNQIGSHSECGQHPAISMEHEMQTLEVVEQQEERLEKEECNENFNRPSADFVCEDAENKNLDIKDLEVDKVQLNEESQGKNPHIVCDSSEDEQYTTGPMENIAKVEVEHSAIAKATPTFVYAKQGADIAENKVEVGVPEVDIVKLEKKEGENESTDQIMDGSNSEENSTDLVKHDMEKLHVSQTELGGHVALDERKGFQEAITDVDNGSACETENPEEEVVAAEGNEECHEGKNHEQADENSCVSEAQMVQSLKNEGGKCEMQVPEGDNLLDKIEDQSEERDLADSNTACEDQAANSEDDNIERFETYHPEIEKPHHASEEYTVDSVENETEKADVTVTKVEDTTPEQAGSNSECEEHAIDSKEAAMDKLEVNRPEVGKPYEVPISRCVDTEHKALHLKPEVDGPEVEDDLLDGKESHSDRPKPDECSSVCGKPMTDFGEDRMDELDMNQPKGENLEEVIDSSTSVNEAHKLDSVKNETERSEVRVVEVDNYVLDGKESQSKKPEQDDSNSLCEENTTDFPEHEEGKLKMNQPDSNQGNANSTSVCKEHMLDSHEDETEKAERALKVEDTALEPKECLGNKPCKDESSSLCEVQATEFREEGMHKLEEPDHNIADVSALEAPTKPPLTNDMKKPDAGVSKVEDNVPERRTCCPGQKTEQNECDYEEHAKGSERNGIDKPDVEDPDEVITVRSVSETDTINSLRNGTQKPEEDVPKVEDNMPEKTECLGEKPNQDESNSVLEEHAIDSKEDDKEKPKDRVPKVENNVLECFGEKTERDDSSFVLEEHTPDYKAGGRDKLEVEQQKVIEPDQFIASSAAATETHTLASLVGKAKQPWERVLEVEDNAMVLKECLGQETEQDKNSFLCEEHTAEPKEDDMNKLAVNQPKIGESHQVIAESTPVIETYKLDLQETKTEKNEELPEVKDNVPEEKNDEKPHQEESNSVREEHASKSEEDNVDKLKVNVPKPDQDNVSLEKECLDGQPDQDDDRDVLEMHLQEPDQFTTRGTPLSEHTLNSTKNETEEPKVRVPVVEDDGSGEKNLHAVELLDLPTEDKKEKELGEGPGNKSQEQQWQMEVICLPAESKSKTHEIEFMQTSDTNGAPRPQEGTPKILEQLDAAKPKEAKQEPMHHLQDQEVHQIEESSLTKGTQKDEAEKGDAAMPSKSTSSAQEEDRLNLTTDRQEIEAKEISTHIDAKERFSASNELEDETQEQHSPLSILDQQESPADIEKAYNIQEVSATQYQSDNIELSCERDVNTTLETDQTSSIEQQSGQKEAHKDVAALAVHEGQSTFKVEDQATCTEYDEHTLNVLCKELAPTDDDCGTEKISTQEGQKLLGGIDDVKDEFQTVKETSAAPKVQEGDFALEEIALVCIQHNIHVAILESKIEPVKEDHEKQQHEEHKPKDLNVKAEDAKENEMKCNLNIPILSSEDGMKQAFQSVPIPAMASSSPSDLLPLPL